MTRTLDYEFVRGDDYPHQVTVKDWPGRVARLFGAQPREWLLVSQDWHFSTMWYYMPTMEQFAWYDHRDLIKQIEALIRQTMYVERQSA